MLDPHNQLTNTLYLLGGVPRCGKSTIVKRLVEVHPMPSLSIDALQESLRQILIGSQFKLLGNVAMSGFVETRIRGEEYTSTPFEFTADAHELTREMARGVLSHYERAATDLAIEGQLITPAWAKAVSMGRFAVRAAFVGYSDKAHVVDILEHAKLEPHDWVNWWLHLEPNAESNISAWVGKQVELSKAIASQAESAGYPYFDLSVQPFDMYVNRVVDYLLPDNED